MAGQKRKRFTGQGGLPTVGGRPKKTGSKSKKFKKTQSSSKVSFGKNSFSGRALDKGDGQNVTATYSRKRGKSVKSEGRSKKKVTVSKSLRSKIKKVLTNTVAQGWYKEITWPSGVNGVIIPADNQQVVFYPTQSSGSSGTLDGTFFDPCAVLNAASILWNGKVLGSATNSKLFTDLGNFSTQTLQVHVIESNVVIRFKNNTAHTMTLKIWDCSPKSANVNATGMEPIEQWTSDLTSQAPGGLIDGGQNPNSNTVITLTNSPQHCEAFMKAFSVDETIVTLEGGKEYNHKLTGPKDFMYEFAKYFVTGTISNYQKMNKFVMCAMYVGLDGTVSAAGNVGAVGRSTSIAANTGYGLLCEATSFYRLSLPEQAGVRVTAPLPGGVNNVSLTNRRNAYAIQVMPNNNVTAPIVVVDEEPGDIPAPVTI